MGLRKKHALHIPCSAPRYNARMSDASSPFDALKPLAGRALQEGINRAIALDALTAERIASLEDRRVVLRLVNPALAMQLQVRQGKILVGKVEEGIEPDLGVRATISGLFAQLPGLRGAMPAKPGQVRIEGDAELAREVQKIVERFDPDFDEGFVRALGPVIGPQVARVLRRGFQEAQVVAKKLVRDAVDYAVEEQRDVLGKAELEAFFEDVDRLRDDVERAAARLQRLAGRSA